MKIQFGTSSRAQRLQKVAGLGRPILSHFLFIFLLVASLARRVTQHFCDEVGRPNPAAFFYTELWA